MKDWKAKKACVDCGFVRTVRVRDWEDGHLGVRWSKRCGACELVDRAVIHEQIAAGFRRRANTMMVRRRARLEGNS